MQQPTEDFVGPASPGQRLLWVFERRRAAFGALNTPVIARLRAPVSIKRIEQSVVLLAERHDSLRTRLLWKAPRLLRTVSSSWRPALRIEDLSHDHAQLESARSALTEELTRSVSAKDWPFRPLLLVLGPDDFIVCLNIHHSATDAVSNAILLEELAALLKSESPPSAATLPEPGWSYSQWVAWQAEKFENAFDSNLSYWQEKLRGAEGPHLPEADSDAPLERRTAFSYALVDENIYRGLIEISLQERTTVFSVILAIFYLALSRQTGQTDLTVTTLLSDRVRPEIFRTVGYFVSGVALRAAFKPQESLPELIRRCRATLFEAVQHQAMPFHMLPRPPAERSELRIDDVVIQMLGETQQLPEPFEPFDWRPDFGGGRTFDLEFVVHQLGPSIMINVLYGAHRFSAELIESLIADFVRIAEQAALDPGRPIHALLGTRPSVYGSPGHD